MFKIKRTIVVPALSIIMASIQPAFATVPIPGPIIGAGLPALAILGGGYWLIKKLRKLR
jgi:hypothetical protein